MKTIIKNPMSGTIRVLDVEEIILNNDTAKGEIVKTDKKQCA